MDRTHEHMLARHYPFRAIVEPAGGWSIVFPDLPGCTSYAERWEDIGTNARIAFTMWMEAEIARGHTIPTPSIGSAAGTFHPEAFDVVMNDQARAGADCLSARDVARHLGITPRRVSAIAKRRGVGRIIGGVRLFAPEDMPALTPGPPGRPRTPRSLEGSKSARGQRVDPSAPPSQGTS